jgi:hypothetical protein
MKTIEIQLDEQTFERAQRLAEIRRHTLESLIAEIVQHLAAIGTKIDPLLDMFADEPEMIDQIIESAMVAREAHPLRLANGQSAFE